MRALILVLLLTAAACRVPYTADIADMTVMDEDLPKPGAAPEALTIWFHEHGYSPGPPVLQAEAELRRRPGDPLVYALQKDRQWWLTQSRAVRDFCVTQRTIYYTVDDRGHLMRAIGTHRSQC